MSTKSIYTRGARCSKPGKAHEREDEQSAEIRQLNQKLARVIEERNILKKATAYFVRESQ